MEYWMHSEIREREKVWEEDGGRHAEAASGRSNPEKCAAGFRGCAPVFLAITDHEDMAERYTDCAADGGEILHLGRRSAINAPKKAGHTPQSEHGDERVAGSSGIGEERIPGGGEAAECFQGTGDGRAGSDLRFTIRGVFRDEDLQPFVGRFFGRQQMLLIQSRDNFAQIRRAIAARHAQRVRDKRAYLAKARGDFIVSSALDVIRIDEGSVEVKDQAADFRGDPAGAADASSGNAQISLGLGAVVEPAVKIDASSPESRR